MFIARQHSILINMAIREAIEPILLSEKSQPQEYIKNLSDLKSQQYKITDLQMILHRKEIAKRIKIYKILTPISHLDVVQIHN